MKTFLALILTFVTCVITTQAHALPYNRLFRDIKLPTQAVLQHETIAIPLLAATNYIQTSTATSASVTTTVTSFAHQPDVCRNITITPGGTTADVPAGDVVVTGTNFKGQTITENITFAANASTATLGSKAFCTISSVVYPIQDGGSATYIVGIGAKLGLKKCAANAGALAWSVFDGAYESTRGTLATSATAVESNTFTPNGSPNGAKNVEVYYVQNFGC